MEPAAAALPAPAADAKAQGEQPVQVKSGGRAEMTREGDATFTGGVTIVQGEREVSADAASYDASERRFEVEGNVEYRSPDLRLKGGSGSWNAIGTGQFTGAEFELPQRPARGSADTLEMDNAGTLKLSEVRFTTCPAGNTDWELRASSIEIDQKTQQGKGRNVRVDLKGVPILFTPVISFPVGDMRKSGFLFPSFGNSDKSGFELGVPYYFNLAPNYDLTLTPFLLSRRGFGLGMDYRYLTERSHGKFGTDYLPGDDLANRDRRLSTLVHQTNFTDRLRLDADLADASDSRYFEDFGLGPDGTSITFLDRRVQLVMARRRLATRRPRTGSPGHRRHGRPPGPPLLAPAAGRIHRPVAPARRIRGLVRRRDRLVRARNRRHRAARRRHAAHRVGTARARLSPRAERGLARHRLRALGHRAGADDSPHRSAPILSLDSGLVFERQSGERDQFVHTLEPRLRYTWIPFRDQDDLPVFDTALPDLNLVQLFRTNRYVGADRLGDANELAAGLTTRLMRAESGQQYLSATIGQRFYFESPRVVLPGELRGDAQRLEPGRRGRTHRLAQLERTRRRRMGRRTVEHPARRGAASSTGPARTRWSTSAIAPARDSSNSGTRGFAWRVSPSWQLYARRSTRRSRTSRSTASPGSSTRAAAGACASWAAITCPTAPARATIRSCCRWNSRAFRRSEPAATLSWNAAFGDTPPPPIPPTPEPGES